MADVKYHVWEIDRNTHEKKGSPLYSDDDIDAAQCAARENYANPVPLTFRPPAPVNTHAGGFENKPSTGTYTLITWVRHGPNPAPVKRWRDYNPSTTKAIRRWFERKQESR